MARPRTHEYPILGDGAKARGVDGGEPPTIETNRIPIMPEQRHIEAVIPPPPTIEVEDAKKRRWTKEEAERIDDERFIRVRVKRIGGFVKGLSKEGQDKVIERMAKYNREPKDGWDMTIHIPGFDNASHAHNQHALFEKPVKMIQVEKA